MNGDVSIRVRSLADFNGGDYGLFDTKHHCVGSYHNGPLAEYELVVIASKPSKQGEQGEFVLRGKAPKP